MAAKKFDITKHLLVPKHSKLSEKEKEALLQKYQITIKELPRIRNNDPALQGMDLKQGDVVKIVRQSPTAGECIFCRGVFDE